VSVVFIIVTNALPELRAAATISGMLPG
jgi:hypothetical protein